MIKIIKNIMSIRVSEFIKTLKLTIFDNHNIGTYNWVLVFFTDSFLRFFLLIIIN